MPTEDSNLMSKQLFFEDRFGNIQKLGELQQFEINNTHERDNAVDSLRYAVETKTEKDGIISVTISKETLRQLQKRFGIQKISKKRFIKLLMGCRMQKKDAEKMAEIVRKKGLEYSPIVAKKVIEIFIMNLTKEECK